jgi:hypothetical protein
MLLKQFMLTIPHRTVPRFLSGSNTGGGSGDGVFIFLPLPYAEVCHGIKVTSKYALKGKINWTGKELKSFSEIKCLHFLSSNL